MFLNIIYIISVFLFNGVKCVDISAETWRNMDNEVIKVPEYCKSKNKPCLIKCCPENRFIEVRNKKPICTEAKDDEMKRKLKFTDVFVHKNSNDSTTIATKDNIEKGFIFVRNDAFFDLSKTFIHPCKFFVIEDGSIYSDSCLFSIPALEFCVDITARYRFGNRTLYFKPRLVGKENDGRARNAFIKIGLSVSAVFCFLVLVVYSLLPKLRTLPGLLTMAYLATFVGTCVIKTIELERIDSGVDNCNIVTSAILYFFILATFFWLNVMSFDLWRMATRPLQRSNTYCNSQLIRREWKKLIYFCVYAWITPVVLTLIVVAIDKYELYSDPDYQPPFKDCFIKEIQVMLYVRVPIGILIIANIILFAIAAYTIWVIRGKADGGTESSNINKTQSRFFLCFKLFIVTGVAWILELVPTEKFSVFIAVNFFNVFQGLPIFWIFVCNKKIILQLCKRLNIFTSFVERQQSSRYKSEPTKSSRMNSQKTKRDEEECPAEMMSLGNHTEKGY